MEMDVDKFRKRFPNLYREIYEGKMMVKVTGIRNTIDFAEKKATTKMPSVIDYLRRCDTDEQGREVIGFMLRKGEITSEEAETLLKQLEGLGIRSFGTRKEIGHYFRGRG